MTRTQRTKASLIVDNYRNLRREAALALVQAGLSTEQVAKKLGLRHMQVAAYLAHQTMGTYS